MFRDKKTRRGLYIFIAAGAALTAAGFFIADAAGWLMLLACAILAGVHFYGEYRQYSRLRQLTADLDELLNSGVPLPISGYAEGEMSILANQIQKITLRLMESKEVLLSEKEYLADSLADISHQLRTPLTAMNLTAAMLSSDSLPDGRRYELTMELKNLLTATGWLIESLLKLSRLDAGMIKMEKECVTVRELIERAAAPLAIPMDVRGQRLTVDCRDEKLTCDIAWTAEAVGNILKNCTEHTPERGEITVTAQETALFTQITVEDTGPGFNAADIPHLFERFYKGENAAGSSYGIGLALVHDIITAQDGTVKAENYDGGARFTIKFYKQVL